ncbi:MAG: glycosyl hydrolase family 79 C-terminal domain-containing protein [Solirubrobacteraceae bacterium]
MGEPLRKRQLPVLAIGAVAVAAAVVAALATAGSGDPPPAASAAYARAPLVAKPRHPLTIGGPVGRAIPSGFLGFSIEFQAIRAYTGSNPAQINPVLVQLIRNLTPGQAPVIRIGGHSTDASWVPTAGVKPPPQVTYALTPSWFATTDALIRALGARVIAGINLGANQPALAAAEARADVRAFGPALEAFEIGNEPDVYDVIPAYQTHSGRPVLTRPPGYAYPDYLGQFRSIASELPPLDLAGPALAAGPTPSPGWYVKNLSNFLAAERRVQILTIHRYPLRNCYVGKGSPQYPTVPHLLSSYATDGLAAGVQAYISLAHAAHRQLRLDELNSVACRGKAGVSNTFASSLWVLDALFALARAGVDGVNMHTLPNSAYQLFKFSHTGGRWSATVAPLYYGLDMFARAAAPGSRLLRIHGARGPALSVWATRAPDGQLRAVVVNENVSKSETVGFNAPPGSHGPATLLRMQAPSAWARGHVTIGGASFGAQTATGVLPQPRPRAISRSDGAYSLVVPPASAALISFG